MNIMRFLPNNLIQQMAAIKRYLPQVTSLRQGILLVLVIQTVFGFLIAFIGFIYTRTDERSAAEMIEYIRDNNPAYYQVLVNEENKKYRREFFNHFKIHGNRRLLLYGLFIFVVAGHLAVAALYMTFTGKLGEPHAPPEPEREGQGEPEAAAEGGEEGEGASGGGDDELF